MAGADGIKRAGFYGYDVLANLDTPRAVRNAVGIVPELQRLAVGDALPCSAAGNLIVHAITPDQSLMWSGISGACPGACTWALHPLDLEHTRLVSRIQWSHH